MISEFELGWLCALLEGEGWFEFRSNTQRVGIQMTDEDTILRYASIVERVTGKKPHVFLIQRKRIKDIYHTVITGPNARKVMRLIVKHMGDRRRIRIWQCLNGHTAVKGKTLAELGFDISNLTMKVP